MARIDLWSYDNPQKIPEHLKKQTLKFNGDIDDGINCMCGFCGENINIIEDETEECPKCYNDLIFPRNDW